MTDEIKLETIFDDLYGPQRAFEDGGNRKHEREARLNDQAERDFNNTQRERLKSLESEAQIRVIVREQLDRTLLSLLWFGGFFYAGHVYGLVGYGGLLLTAAIWLGLSAHKQRRSVSFKLEEVDALAEDTVLHERIAELAASGSPTELTTKELLSHPYWTRVRAQVTKFLRINHEQRVKANCAARAASLPYRRDILAACGESSPWWASVRPDEANS